MRSPRGATKRLQLSMAAFMKTRVSFISPESPFFDNTSNNAIVYTQALASNPTVLGSRQTFEHEISKLSGKEYRVVESHSSHGPDVMINQGQWVIRCQLREKREGGLSDKITVLETYYVLGDLISKSPSLEAVIRTRLLDSMQKMEKFAQRFPGLSSFTPAGGHQYIKQSDNDIDRSRAGSTAASRVSTPALGQEDIVMAGSQDSGDLIKSSSIKSNPTAADSRALVDASRIFARYGNEYMDDLELVGEPGNFIFRRTEVQPPPQSRVAPSQPTQSTQETSQASQSQDNKDTGSPRVKNESMTDTEGGGSSLVSRPKAKRKKTKAPNAPNTPTTPLVTATRTT